MIVPDILKDTLASQIFFHLLYSGPRTNKHLSDDLSILQLRTKRGVVLAGSTGYNYIRNTTEQMADIGILKTEKASDGLVYRVDLQGLLGKLLFDIRDTAGLGYAHQSLKYVPGYFDTLFSHRIMQQLLSEGIGEFNSAFGLEEHDARHKLFNYKAMLEHTSKNVRFGLMLFLVKLCEKVTEVPYDRMWWDIVKRGSSQYRQEIVADIDSYNFNTLPEEMKTDITEERMKLYIDRYHSAIGMPAIAPLVTYWVSKAKVKKQEAEDFLPYAYLMQRIFIYLLHTMCSEGFYEHLLSFEFPMKGIQLHPEHRAAVESIGMKRAVDVLRRVNSYLIVKKKRMLPDDVRRAVIYEGDLYLPNEFTELVSMRYRDETAEKIAEQNAFLRSIGGKETKVLSLNNAISITMSKAKVLDVIDIIHLLHIVIANTGPDIMSKLRKMQEVLEQSYGYRGYFKHLNEMYQIKLP